MMISIFYIVWMNVFLTIGITSSTNYESAIGTNNELSCLSREDTWADTPLRVTHHLRSMCHDDASHEAKNKCTPPDVRTELNTYDMVPVIDTESNVTYKNIYCALCNKVDPSHVAFWKVRLKCAVSANVTTGDLDHDIPGIVASNACEATFQTPYYDLDRIDTLPYSSPEECYFSAKTCNVTGDWANFDAVVEKSCDRARFHALIWKGVVFENLYCATCNEIRFAGTGTDGYRGYGSWYGVYSAWLHFSYELFYDKLNDISQEHRCTPNQFNSDTLMQKQCLNTRCSPLRHMMHGNECERRLHLLEKYTYRICLRLRPRTQLTIKEAAHAWSKLHEPLVDFLRNIIHFAGTSVYKYEIILFSTHTTAATSVPSQDDVVNSQFLYYDWRMKIMVEDLDPEDNLNRLRLFVENSDLVIPTDDATYAFDATLKDYVNEEYMIVSPYDPICMSENPWPWCEEIDWNLTQLTTSPPTQRIALGFGEHYSSQFNVGPISTERNILEMRDCVFVKVTRNETQWTDTGFGLNFPHSGVLLSYMDFVYDNSDEVVWMCKEMYFRLFEGIRQETNDGEEDVQSVAFVLSVTDSLLVLMFCAILHMGN